MHGGGPKDHGKQHKCCQVYRAIFSEDFLKVIDKGKYIVCIHNMYMLLVVTATNNSMYEDESSDNNSENQTGNE